MSIIDAAGENPNRNMGIGQMTIRATSGDLSIADVANYYGISVERLLAMNPKLRNRFPGAGNIANVRIPRGFTLTLPRQNQGDPTPGRQDDPGQARKIVNVYQNRRYIRNRQEARNPSRPGAGGGGGGAGGEDDGLPEVPGATPGGDDTGGEDDNDIPGGTDFQPETPGGLSELEARNAIQAAIAAFPWVAEAGLTDQIVNWIRNEGYTGEALVGLIRQTDQWQSMFVGIRRDDGTLRMNEGQYMATMDAYRGVLQRQFGSEARNYTNAELSNFLVNDIDPNEVADRLQMYDRIVEGGAEIRAAFYVYAGISMSDDDLYNYVVDPFTQRSFDEQYEGAGQIDYGTFLVRTAEVAIDQTGAAISPDQAVPLLDLLYHGGQPLGGDYLSLSELRNAFEYAMLGSTALAQGLDMPDIDTIRQIREAGITRAQALQAYGQFVKDRSRLDAIYRRAGSGEFSQSVFEEGTFLSDGNVQRGLDRALAMEDARAQAAGSFGFGQSSSGGVAQPGFSAFRS